jgi:hypothetical protein
VPAKATERQEQLGLSARERRQRDGRKSLPEIFDRIRGLLTDEESRYAFRPQSCPKSSNRSVMSRGFLLDTMVPSGLSRPRPGRSVSLWLTDTDDALMFRDFSASLHD